MTTLQEIKARLKELGEVREKATKGPWSSDASEDITSPEGDIVQFFRYEKYDLDRDFCITAANEWTSLLTCVEKMSEVLHEQRLSDWDADPTLISPAAKTLAEVAGILKGRGE